MTQTKRPLLWIIGSLLGIAAVLAYFQLRPAPNAASVTPRAYYYPAAYAQDTLIRETGTVISFADVVDAVLPSVVHVIVRKTAGGDAAWYQRFFNQPQNGTQPIASAGSGVLIDEAGYLVTNYHVVKDVETVEIVLHDNRSFDADIVGIDPTTDLALLKIEAENLQAIRLGNSDKARVGDWVLAIGNPFQLRSTVTAGIISAKGRNVNIISTPNRLSVESFIQTDAVVNRGNSGGALVNVQGELIGVNTAIFTQTGAYEGYSFAIPSALVHKVVEDLRAHGSVQRALLGVSITDVNAERAEARNADVFTGVFIETVYPASAAAEAGLQEADIITAVDNIITPNVAVLQEQIAIHRPGDQIIVHIIRNNKPKQIRVRLKGLDADNTLAAATPTATRGLLLGPLGATGKERYGVKQGVMLLSVEKQQWQDMGLRPGLAITHINQQPIRSLKQAHTLLEEADDNLVIAGVYPDGSKAHYGLSF